MSYDYTFWILIVILALATFLLRYSFFFIFDKMTVPKFLKEILPFIPAAALAALVAPQVAHIQLGISFLYQPRFLAWIGAMIVALLTKNMFFTIGSGLALLWLIELI